MIGFYRVGECTIIFSHYGKCKQSVIIETDLSSFTYSVVNRFISHLLL